MNPIYSLYIHLPFCREICPFCGFAVLKDHRPERGFYLDLLEQEWQGLLETFNPEFSALRSIYLGGGTPSRLSLSELERLCSWLPARPEQMSIEANPEDISPAYARGLADLGFNRVSLGTQSFSDRHLGLLGRQHRRQDILQALAALKQAGLKNFNVDLIFGYPGQSEADLAEDLKALIDTGCTHLSAYALSIEPKTPWARKTEYAQWTRDQEEQIAAAYRRVVETCTQAGLAQYEVSNFARPGFESLQNRSNWDRENYLGLGMGAHSLVGQRRLANWRRLKEYKAALLGQGPRWDLDEALSPAQVREEQWMLGLRRPEGIEVYPSEESPALEQSVKQGLAKRHGARIHLTLEGLLLADELTAHFLARQT